MRNDPWRGHQLPLDCHGRPATRTLQSGSCSGSPTPVTMAADFDALLVEYCQFLFESVMASRWHRWH